MIDLHCHIDLYSNPKQVLEICNEKGIYVLSVTTTPSAWPITNQLGEDYARIKTAIGLHPHLAQDREFELPLFESYLTQTKYVGEIGLDGGSEYAHFWNVQVRVFESILNACTKAGGKIMSIHSRNAASYVLSTLKNFPFAGIPILHWYSGTNKELEVAIDLGCWFSVNPRMTRSKRGREIVRLIPKDRLLPETDGPFVIHSNSTLYPWNSDMVIKDLSLIWGIPLERVETVLMENFKTLLKLKHGKSEPTSQKPSGM